MKPIVTLLAVGILAACATVPDGAAYLPAQGSACIEQRPNIDGRATIVRWCIASQMFQPRKYAVTIDGNSVFDGTDYQRVEFTARIQGGPVQGACDEYVTLIESKSNLPAFTAIIPPTAVTACKIGTTPEGRSTQFLISKACDQHFYKDIGPLVGPLLPVENRRVCTLNLNGRDIFEGTFLTARRF